MDVAQARAVLTLDDTQYQREIKKAGQAFDQMGKDVQAAGKQAAANVGAALSSLGTRFSIGITAPLAALGAASIRSATQMDSLKRGLTAVSGSSAEANRQLKRLNEVAKLPGLGRVEAIQGSIQLQAAGLSARTAERSLRAFGNALATVGKGKADLDGVTLALTQITSKGKVTAEEINQIAERVPQIRVAMQKAFGTASTEELQKMGISAREFIEKINTELLKLPQVTGGAQNAFENLQDAVRDLTAAIGQQLLPTVLPIVERLTKGATELAESFGRLPAPVRQSILVFAGLAAAAGPVLLVSGQLIGAFRSVQTLLPGMVTGIRAVGVAVMALPLPLKFAVLAVGALAAAWATDFGGIRTTTMNFIEWATPALQATWDAMLTGVKSFLSDFQTAWSSGIAEIQQAWASAFDGMGESILNGLLAPFRALSSIYDKLPAPLKAFLGRVTGADTVGGLMNFAGEAWGRFKQYNDLAATNRALWEQHNPNKPPKPSGIPGDDGGPYTRDPKTKKQGQTPFQQAMEAMQRRLNQLWIEGQVRAKGYSEEVVKMAGTYKDAAMNADGFAKILDLVNAEQDESIRQSRAQAMEQYRKTLQQSQSALADAMAGPKGGLAALREQFSRHDSQGRIVEQLVPDELLKKIMEANTATKEWNDHWADQAKISERVKQTNDSLTQSWDNVHRQLGALRGVTNAQQYAFVELGLRWKDLNAEQRETVQGLFEWSNELTRAQERVEIFRQVASGMENIFLNAFGNIRNGFGGFFSSIVSGFQQMLQRMAAEYLSSRLASVFTQLLGNVFGGMFGGVASGPKLPPGVSSGNFAGGLGQAVKNSFGNLKLATPGRAIGGYVGAGKPYMVGEQGPEYFVPRASGQIVPAGAGAGGNITINMTVHATDAQSFRNDRSIMADMWNEARRAQRRDGG